jgi:hypothetical protein
MAQSAQPGHRQRITVRVVDAATGEEHLSGELTILPGFCSYSCCSSHHPVVRPPPPVDNLPQTRA